MDESKNMLVKLAEYFGDTIKENATIINDEWRIDVALEVFMIDEKDPELRKRKESLIIMRETWCGMNKEEGQKACYDRLMCGLYMYVRTGLYKQTEDLIQNLPNTSKD